MKVGTLTITAAMPQKGAACEKINFDPLVMEEGIAATNDPVLLFRSPAYAVSFAKRLGGQSSTPISGTHSGHACGGRTSRQRPNLPRAHRSQGRGAAGECVVDRRRHLWRHPATTRHAGYLIKVVASASRTSPGIPDWIDRITFPETWALLAAMRNQRCSSGPRSRTLRSGSIVARVFPHRIGGYCSGFRSCSSVGRSSATVGWMCMAREMTV